MNQRRGWGRNGQWVKPNLRKYYGSGNEDRSLDLTFSFGRKIELKEVNKFLLDYAFDHNLMEMREFVDQIHVDRRSIMKEQVLVTCLVEGQNEQMVTRLESAMQEGIISHCHTYGNDEVTVIVDMLHPSVNIQEDFVDNVLVKEYGSVKMWFPRRDSWTKFKTGEYVFIMKGEELKERPIPRKIMFNDKVLYVHYNSQPMICHQCGRAGHKAQDCEYPAIGGDDTLAEIQARRVAQEEMEEQKRRMAEIEKEASAYRNQVNGTGNGVVVHKHKEDRFNGAEDGVVVHGDEEKDGQRNDAVHSGDESARMSGAPVDEVPPIVELPEVGEGEMENNDQITDGDGSSVDPANEMALGAEAVSLMQGNGKEVITGDGKKMRLLDQDGQDQDTNDDEDSWTHVQRRGRKNARAKMRPKRTGSLDLNTRRRAQSQPRVGIIKHAVIVGDEGSRPLLVSSAKVAVKSSASPDRVSWSADDPLDPINSLD